MRTPTIAAQAAKLIRKDLKEHFPNIKFKVISENYAGGNSINIGYENGVPEQKIKKIVSKYKQGHFDGMTDCYEYSNSIEGLPQVSYIFTSRTISQEVKERAKIYLCKYHGLAEFTDTEVL